MATSMSQEDINYLRLAGLLIRIAPRAVRQQFDFEFNPVTLSQFLSKNRSKIDELTKKRVLTKAQYDLLYPKGSSGFSPGTFDVSLMVCLLRHFTDLDIQDGLPLKQIHNTGADISRIKFYRNYIVHSNSGKVFEDEFTEIWNIVEEAILRLLPDLKSEIGVLMGSPLTNVGEMTDILRLEKKLEKTSQDLDATSQKVEKLEIENNNISKIRDATLKEWRYTDRTYISTLAMTFILETLQHNLAVIITGSPGCGKSTVAHHVALKLEKEGFELVPCDEPSEILKNFITMKMQVFVIDDVCGKFALNQHEADSWEKNNVALDRLMVSCNKNDNISKCSAKFIFTCRENIYNHKTFPKLTCFSLVQCSFSTKHKISQVEMRKIALSYVSDETVNDIQNICLYDFFPLLCALYSTMEHPHQRFFIHPVEVIEKEITEMKFKSETSFLCLSLLVLKNNKCCKDELESGELEQLLKDLCRSSEIESVVSTLSIQNSFERFKGIYISESDQSYKAIHDEMFDIISAAIAPSIMECLIKHVDIAFLANRVQLSSLGKSSLPFVIYIPKRLERIYLQRQFKEVIKSNYWEVFGSMQTENEDYRNILLSFMKDQDTSQPIVYVPGVDGATPLFVSSSLGYMNFVQYFLVKSPDDKNAKDKKGRSSFYIACENGHITTVKYLLKCCADPTKKNTNGSSALHAACCSGHTEIVKLLIDVGLDINDTTEQVLTPLYLACREGHHHIAKCLLDLNAQIVKDLNGWTALHEACLQGHIEIVKILIDSGMDVNDTTNNGSTPLLIACLWGRYDIAKCLLDLNSQIFDSRVYSTIKDFNGRTALHASCFRGHTEIVKILIEAGMNVNDKANGGSTPFFLACRQGRYDTVKFFLDLNNQTVNGRVDLKIKDSKGYTALHATCIKGHTDVVKVLIDAGMNVNVTTNRGGSTPLILACRYGRCGTVKFLLDLKVDFLVKNSTGYTALHTACYKGHTEVVNMLINAGMNVNDTTEEGFTPLELACQEGHHETVTSLLNLNGQTLNSRTDLLVKNAKGRTALHAACFYGHTEIVKKLIDAGMDVNDAIAENVTPLFFACNEGHYETVTLLLNLNDQTVNGRADLLVKASNGYTVLHAACYNGHTEVVKLLIDSGMNVTDTSNDGSTPLIIACHQGHYDTAKCLLNSNCPILNSPVNLMVKDLEGRTALHRACNKGHTEIVKILIDAGMDVNDTTNEGSTPLFLACEAGHCDTVQILLDLNCQRLNSRVDLLVKDSNGWTALHAACYYGHTCVVKIFIDADMDTTEEVSTLLNLACQEGHHEIVTSLLDLNDRTSNSPVDLIVKDSEGWTVLHTACYNGHTEVVKILIDDGMNVTDTTNDGSTPLILACHQGHYETAKCLINSNCLTLNSPVDLMVKDLEGRTALHAACFEGHTEVVKLLMDAGMNVNDTTDEGFTPLNIACRQGSYDLVKFLLNLNDQTLNSCVDLMIKDSDGFTSLHVACYNGYTGIVKIFIDAGMDVNYTSIQGLTALHLACFKGHTEVVKLLIYAGMNVNDTTEEGFTPLFFACQEGRFEIVKYLLDLNAVYGETVDACICLTNVTYRVNTSTRNELGSTALHVACLKGNTEVVKLLVDVGMNINDATKMGFTPLYLACQRGCYDTVKFLLDFNCRSLNSELNIPKTESAVKTSLPNLPSIVNTTIKDPLGMSVLHIACSNGYAEVAKLLIDAGTDINDRRYDGKTALHLACLKGHNNVVKTLMDNGAEKDICDKRALSPLIIAQTNGHSDIVKLLEK